MPAFAYARPGNVQEALRLLARQEAAPAVAHAGGTDLLGCLRDRVFPVATLVSIAGLEELRGIAPTPDGGLRLGALATLSQIGGHPVVARHYRALAMAIAEAASPQLRNQGTIGGNLCQKPRCWYYRGEFHCLRKGGDLCYAQAGDNRYHAILGQGDCIIVHPSDPAPALAALGAVVEVQGAKGARAVPVAEFHMPATTDPRRETVLAADELVTGVLLPPPPAGLRSSYRKVRARRSWDFALAGAAIALAMDGPTVREARIWLSGAAPTPWRAEAAEAELRGKPLDEAAIRAASEAAMSGARALSDNGYKLPMFVGMLQEELGRLAGDAGPNKGVVG